MTVTAESAWDIAADIFDPPAEQPVDPETAACAASAEYFIEGHCTIEEPDGTVLPFELWDFQRGTIKDLEHGLSLIVLKARRLGLSWVVLAFILWVAIFRQGTRILVLCKTGDDAAELLDRIRRMRDRITASPHSAHLLEGIPPTAKSRDAVTTLDIGTSTIRALMGTPAAARSETAGVVLLDEFAFQRGAGDIWRAIYPTIEGGGQVAVVSTGNGAAESESIGAEFASLWSRAKRGVTKIRPLFFPWMCRRSRDAQWKADTIAALGDETRFEIEYPETEEQAFQIADADLIYPGVHLDAAELLGAQFDENPNLAPHGPLYLGIDWGVNTHMVLARPLPGGGMWFIREVHSQNADIEDDVKQLDTVLSAIGENPQFIRWDPGAAGAKVIGSFIRQMQVKRPGFKPKRMAIPFSKFKVVAIKYSKMLLRRAHEEEQLRAMAISPSGCPELLRQMRAQEWKDVDTGKTEKGDDHGADAQLTLTAELGFAFFGKDPDTDGGGHAGSS